MKSTAFRDVPKMTKVSALGGAIHVAGVESTVNYSVRIHKLFGASSCTIGVNHSLVSFYYLCEYLSSNASEINCK